MRELVKLILVIQPIILSAHLLHHTLLKWRLHLHVQHHMLILSFIILSLSLVMIIIELMKTNEACTHFHMLLYHTLCTPLWLNLLLQITSELVEFHQVYTLLYTTKEKVICSGSKLLSVAVSEPLQMSRC
jgi:hypothetical protein